MAILNSMIFMVVGVLVVCNSGEAYEDVATPSPDVPEVPNVFVPGPEPKQIQITCIGRPPCRQTWPIIDYEPSQPNYKPFQEEPKIRFKRFISTGQLPRMGEKYQKIRSFYQKKARAHHPSNMKHIHKKFLAVSNADRKYSGIVPTNMNDDQIEKYNYPEDLLSRFYNLPRTFMINRRYRRSPLVVDRIRSPVFVPYFCHKMPCSGPMASFPVGKGENSGRYQLPEVNETEFLDKEKIRTESLDLPSLNRGKIETVTFS